ncbi:MAG: hypothetical protein ACR2KT_15465 [Methylocella sp.]
MSIERAKRAWKRFPPPGKVAKKFRGAPWPLCISWPGGSLSHGFNAKPLVRMEIDCAARSLQQHRECAPWFLMPKHLYCSVVYTTDNFIGHLIIIAESRSELRKISRYLGHAGLNRSANK